MPRRPAPPSTVLGLAIRQRRGDTPSTELAPELGLAHSTLLRLEQGRHRPSADTALVLARWLGWSMEDVMKAAQKAVEPEKAEKADG